MTTLLCVHGFRVLGEMHIQVMWQSKNVKNQARKIERTNISKKKQVFVVIQWLDPVTCEW